jgi:hypothetical protein
MVSQKRKREDLKIRERKPTVQPRETEVVKLTAEILQAGPEPGNQKRGSLCAKTSQRVMRESISINDVACLMAVDRLGFWHESHSGSGA